MDPRLRGDDKQDGRGPGFVWRLRRGKTSTAPTSLGLLRRAGTTGMRFFSLV